MGRERVTFEEYYLSRSLWIQVEKCRGGGVCDVRTPVYVCVGVYVYVCIMSRTLCGGNNRVYEHF